MFRAILSNRKPEWRFNLSPLFLEFLMGKREYACTPWGMPTFNIFGWQKPCYLLQDGYADTFDELMQATAWHKYGTESGNPEVRELHGAQRLRSFRGEPYVQLAARIFGTPCGLPFPAATKTKARCDCWMSRRVRCMATTRWCRSRIQPRRWRRRAHEHFFFHQRSKHQTRSRKEP